jgi:hypothetical protein
MVQAVGDGYERKSDWICHGRVDISSEWSCGCSMHMLETIFVNSTEAVEWVVGPRRGENRAVGTQIF